MILPRLAGAALLLMAAPAHLFDHPDAFLALLQEADLPMASLNAWVGPITEILAGLMLLFGFLSRVGSILAIGAMSVALYTHAVVSGDAWPIEGGEPPFVMALVPLLAGILVLAFGPGPWSLDRTLKRPAADH